jgi:hypothetical protein
MSKFLLINILVRHNVDYNFLNSLKKLDASKFDVVIYDYRPNVISTSHEDDKSTIESEYDVIEFGFDEYDSHQEQIKKEAQSRSVKALCIVGDDEIELCDTFFDYVTDDLFDDENIACVYSDYCGVVEGSEFPIFLSSMPISTDLSLIVFRAATYIASGKTANELLSSFISIHIPEHLYKKQIHGKK